MQEMRDMCRLAVTVPLRCECSIDDAAVAAAAARRACTTESAPSEQTKYVYCVYLVNGRSGGFLKRR